jgi:hypothetical protein
MSQIPQLVKLVKDPLYKRIISHPFKYYSRMTGTTFCLVSITNGISIITDDQRRTYFQEHPDMMSMALLSKSAYYGVLWPAFYFTAVTSPRNAFVLLSSVN